ncbi:MAG: flavodoxin family protein [Deltaproteobacteria bacterium]|nr:flavodoxin family protein [Deltaproteobacteria bacterium]
MSKVLVVYSSLTDNTKKVAEAISAAIPGSELASVDKTELDELKDLSGYEAIIVGFWVDKGRADPKTLKFFEKLKNQTTAFFFTLGAYPDTKHADDVASSTEKLLTEGGNKVLGHFRCQGKVDPNLLEKMKKMLPPDHPHSQMTPERQARLDEAAKHPNEEDFQKAAAFARDTLSKIASK